MHPHTDKKYRTEHADRQKPVAAILGCSDSRVPIELLFDAGFGDLFVVRNAGNIPLPSIIASMEYAVSYLSIPLIIVLGHERCGAIQAALSPNSREELPFHLAQLIGHIRLELLDAGIEGMDEASRHNALKSAEILASGSSLISNRLSKGLLRIEAAQYDLDDSQIDWLGSIISPINERH
jgi:carbonic anhydrase